MAVIVTSSKLSIASSPLNPILASEFGFASNSNLLLCDESVWEVSKSCRGCRLSWPAARIYFHGFSMIAMAEWLATQMAWRLVRVWVCRGFIFMALRIVQREGTMIGHKHWHKVFLRPERFRQSWIHHYRLPIPPDPIDLPPRINRIKALREDWWSVASHLNFHQDCRP